MNTFIRQFLYIADTKNDGAEMIMVIDLDAKHVHIDFYETATFEIKYSTYIS